jgi:hypothetical protein
MPSNAKFKQMAMALPTNVKPKQIALALPIAVPWLAEVFDRLIERRFRQDPVQLSIEDVPLRLRQVGGGHRPAEKTHRPSRFERTLKRWPEAKIRLMKDPRLLKV